MSSTLSPTDTLTSVLAPLPHSRKRRAKKSRETRKKTQPVPSDLLDQLSQHEAKEIANGEREKAESGDVVKEDVVKEDVVKEDVVKEEVVKEELVKEEVERERQEFVLQLRTDTQPATAKETPPKQSAYRPNVRPPPRFRPPGATPSQDMLWSLPSGDDSAQGEGGASGWVEHSYMYMYMCLTLFMSSGSVQVYMYLSVFRSACSRCGTGRHFDASTYTTRQVSIFPSVPSPCPPVLLSSCPPVLLSPLSIHVVPSLVCTVVAIETWIQGRGEMGRRRAVGNYTRGPSRPSGENLASRGSQQE